MENRKGILLVGLVAVGTLLISQLIPILTFPQPRSPSRSANKQPQKTISSKAPAPNSTSQTGKENTVFIPNMVAGGMVILQSGTSAVSVPVVDIQAKYGYNVSGPTPPPIVPIDSLPTIQFNVPKSRADQLTLDWLTTGVYKVRQYGIEFLGSRG